VTEFWSALGGQLRPSLDYRVTLSLDYRPKVTGPLVTTQISRFLGSDLGGASDEQIQFGGLVLNTAVPPQPIANAWVRLDSLGRAEVTNAAGQYVFTGVPRGPQVLRVRAVGFQEAVRNIAVPEPAGDYNVILFP
jgi:hypothetical protein